MENMYMIDLTNLIEAALEVLAIVVVLYLIPMIKAKLSNEQEAKLRGVFEVAVYAAEKIYGAKKGDEKLAYVEEYLRKRGIRVDAMRLKAYVNAAIKKMEQGEAGGGVTIVEHITGTVEPEEDLSGEEDEEMHFDEIPDEEDAQEEA